MLILENRHFALKLDENCVAKSLIHKATGTECLDTQNLMPMFSVTEPRPYNNEIKLAHPNKKMTFCANRVRREGNRLIVGFELIGFEAVVEVKEADDYIGFSLVDFIVHPEDFEGLSMSPPPVCEFRTLQLPVKSRERFGELLNVLLDDEVAVNVLGAHHFARIDAEKRNGFYIMSADSLSEIKLKNVPAALVVCSPDKLLDCIDSVECDYDLPRGVKSRRSGKLNSSSYWVSDITPANVDQHIYYAKKFGFRMMLVYFSSFVKAYPGYSNTSVFEYNENYPCGIEDLKNVLKKIKDAGIVPGLHLLHTHIGINSSYVTPVADHRLNLTRHFTLAEGIGVSDTEIFVEQNPEGTVMFPDCRVLQFGGELISYENYTTEWPYRFSGCKRGHFNTKIKEHALGTIGGILDISEYTATSVYLDQKTSLQDEIAEKYVPLFDSGFEFIYYDGSEGVSAPFEINVPYAQYRIYRKLKKAPLYCEGAAKAHFSWHMLSGGNAFDVFPADVFKEKIVKHPLEEAPRMANDFTRLNFGWWEFTDDMQADIYEFGTSKAASWDCPVSVQTNICAYKTNPRAEDIFEVMRRWEDIREKNLLTKEQKELLKDPDTEYTLLVNENGEYELTPYYRIACAEKDITAYYFERGKKNYVVFWHTRGEAKLCLDLCNCNVVVEKDIGKEKIPYDAKGNTITVTASDKKYLSTTLSKAELVSAFENAKITG